MDDFGTDPSLSPYDAPPPPSDPQPDGSASGPAMNMPVSIGTNESSQTNIANVLNQYFDEPTDARTFSVEMAAPLSDDLEKELQALIVIDDESVAHLLGQLERHRVLLLTGDRDSGKATVAKYLATRIAEAHDLPFEALVFEPLERRVRILIRTIADKRADFGERVTVFTEAFRNRNPDLMTFFTADRAAWDQLAATLRKNDAYWIFTSANVDLDPIRPRLPHCVACHELPVPAPDTIPEGVDRKLRWLETKQSGRAERLHVLATNRDRLVLELKTVSRIHAFIDDFVRDDLELDRALEQFNKASAWFAHELITDVDAWCFALTLTLTESIPDAPPVSWSDFEELRRAVTERIKSDPEIFPRRRSRGEAGTNDVDEQTTGACLTDDALLKRCRAVIRKDADGVGDVVAFEDERRASELWETMLHHNRRVLTTIVPLLRNLVENGTPRKSVTLRILAAQILGRIGAIDPAAITLPLIQRDWIGKAGVVLRPMVGRLLQGVLASGNEKYQQAALRSLEDLATVDPTRQLDRDARDRLITAIAAYSQLGDYPAAGAVEHLGDVAIEHCAPWMAEMHQMFMLAEKTNRDGAATSSRRRAERLRARGRGLNEKAHQMLAQQAPILVALEQALVYLCVMSDDPVQTLTATRDWIAKGGPATGMLLTLLFLREGGIADRLETFAVDVPAEHGIGSISPLVLSAASSRASILALCAFLADLHGSINTMFSLPADVQRNFQERFAACLTMWARGAAPAPLFREVMEELFAVLASVRAGALRRDLFMVTETSPFMEDPTMSAFAAAVRKRLE